MSFYHLPSPWNPGYAIPEYVMAEPPGRGTITTKMMARGTIPTLVPDFLAKREKLEGLGATNYYTLEPLGASSGMAAPGFKGDPIKAYGQRASEWIMGTIGELPAEDRKVALRALLETVDPTLWANVASRADKYKGMGMTAKVAMKKALAVSMSDGMVRELVKAGSGQGIKKVSALGLGAYDDAWDEAMYQAMGELEALGWCGPVCLAKKAGSGIKSAAKATYGAGKAVVTAPVRAVSYAAKKGYSGAKWVGGKVASGAGQVVDWVGTGLSKLGQLACGVANSSLGPMAGAAGAAAMGAPPQVGAMGVQVAGSLCGKEGVNAATEQQLQTPAGGGGLPGWVLPAAIGGGALVLVLALRK